HPRGAASPAATAAGGAGAARGLRPLRRRRGGIPGRFTRRGQDAALTRSGAVPCPLQREGRVAMSIETSPACTLGLTRDDLSGGRDGFPGDADRERTRPHMAPCAACQERLADFDALAQVLLRQPVPAPDARLWAAIQSAAERRTRQSVSHLLLPLSAR